MRHTIPVERGSQRFHLAGGAVVGTDRISNCFTVSLEALCKVCAGLVSCECVNE